MLVSIFMHTMENQGIVREVGDCETLIKFAREIGWERIQRIVITDLRPIEVLDGNKKTYQEPDL